LKYGLQVKTFKSLGDIMMKMVKKIVDYEFEKTKTLSEKDKLKLIKELLKFKYTKIPLTQIELMLEELDL
jgi:hypothetical protein